jgi:ubiquinone/menaquinone biosynthesis C-methylase UbiE
LPPRLLCPACAEPLIPAKNCKQCDFTVETVSGISDLRRDKSFDTHLNIDGYDAQHNVIANNNHLANVFYEMMQIFDGTLGGDILEIASGSGNLTVPLIASEKFNSISASDISLGFMKLLSKKAPPSKTKLHRFLFDANSFPFQNEQFNFVLGNSVLHHFSNFENSLREARRVLRPGGVAVFGEPIMDTHAFVSLAAGMISRFVDGNGNYSMERSTLRILKVIQGRATKKMNNLISDRTNLNHVEDKFQFPLNYMRDLTEKLGFSNFEVRPTTGAGNLGHLARKGIERTFRQQGRSAEFLDDFKYLFDALDEDYGKPLSDYIHPLFSFFAYEK